MGKAPKSTKRFNKNHLKRTIEQRRVVQKFNQRELQKKSKAKRYAGNGAKEESQTPTASKAADTVENMNTDDFFNGGFEELQEQKLEKKSKKSKKQAQESSDEESDADEVSSDEEAVLDHKDDLSKLAENDPEFYKYLQENDADLLDFNPTNPLDAMSDDDDEDDEDEDEGKAKKAKKEKAKKGKEDEKVVVTVKMVKAWEKSVTETPNIKGLKNICTAFRAAANVHRDVDEDTKYAVTDEDAFDSLLNLCLTKVPAAFQNIVPITTNKAGVRLEAQGKKLKQLNPVIKTYSAALQIFLKDSSNKNTTTPLLGCLQEILPYILSHRKLLKGIVTDVCELWSTTGDEQVQLISFAFLNNAAKEYPKSLLEIILRTCYLDFIKNARKTNSHNMDLINMQKNSLAELFSIDENLSYQIGFDYIRQLAIHLRNSTVNQTKESYKVIYNWQYAHSLDFWSRAIAACCTNNKETLKGKVSPLRELVYPLVQVSLGAIRLIPTAQFIPFRFYIIRSLLRISRSVGTYIPISPLLLEVVESSVYNKKPKPATLPPFDFQHEIRANQAYLGTRVYQDGISEHIVELFGEFFVLYCKGVSFPELVIPVIITLRKFIKTSKTIKFNKMLSNLIEKLKQNSEFINAKRANVEFGPDNLTEVDRFLMDFDWEKTPLGAYIVIQRQVQEEKAKLLKESMEDSKNNTKEIDEADAIFGRESDNEHASDSEEESEEDDD